MHLDRSDYQVSQKSVSVWSTRKKSLLFNFQLAAILNKRHPNLNFEIKNVEILLKLSGIYCFDFETRELSTENFKSQISQFLDI